MRCTVCDVDCVMYSGVCAVCGVVSSAFFDAKKTVALQRGCLMMRAEVFSSRINPDSLDCPTRAG